MGGLNGLHVVALLDVDIDPQLVPKKVREAFAPIIQQWRALPAETREKVRMMVERRARMSFGKPDPYPEEDLTDVEDEF